MPIYAAFLTNRPSSELWRRLGGRAPVLRTSDTTPMPLRATYLEHGCVNVRKARFVGFFCGAHVGDKRVPSDRDELVGDWLVGQARFERGRRCGAVGEAMRRRQEAVVSPTAQQVANIGTRR